MDQINIVCIVVLELCFPTMSLYFQVLYNLSLLTVQEFRVIHFVQCHLVVNKKFKI